MGTNFRPRVHLASPAVESGWPVWILHPQSYVHTCLPQGKRARRKRTKYDLGEKKKSQVERERRGECNQYKRNSRNCGCTDLSLPFRSSGARENPPAGPFRTPGPPPKTGPGFRTGPISGPISGPARIFWPQILARARRHLRSSLRAHRSGSARYSEGEKKRTKNSPTSFSTCT